MTQEQINELRKFALASKNRPDLQVEHVVFRSAANPAAIIALIQQRDELLAALKDAGFILDMLRTASNGEKRVYAKSFACSTVHVSPIIKGIEAAIAKAEAQS